MAAWPGQSVASAYDLASCLRRALDASPLVHAADVDVRIAEAQADQARAARFLPKFELTWIVGPSPEARGDALRGETDLWNLSAFTRTEATLIQPLFTFGRLAAARSAATSGVEARKEGLRGARLDLELQVAKAYYGLLLAEHLQELAEEARREIGKARDRVEEKLEEDEGDYTYTDLFRLDRFVFDVEENAHKVEKGHALVRSSLKRLLGLTAVDTLSLADDVLAPVGGDLAGLEAYLDRVDARTDLRQLRSLSALRSAQARAARAELYPQFFLGGQFKYGRAPNRDDQKSPFARDDFNLLQAGAVVGFQQSLSFGTTSAKLRKARLEGRKLEALREAARMGAGLDIERAYGELKEARANVEAAARARRATRRWFVAARDGFNAGLEPASEIIDAVKEYGVIRAKYFHAVYAHNVAWAGLRRATGQSLLVDP